MIDWFIVIAGIIKGILVPALPLAVLPGIILFERKIIGWVQERPGPNRVGPWGLLQGVIDGLKLIFKEDLVPRGANLFLFNLAPCIVIIVAFTTMAIIPFGPYIEIFGRTISMSLLSSEYGLIFFLAIGSLGVYGIVISGWASNNKWSLLGGIRSSAQLVSYEITMSFTIAGVLLLAGSLNVYEITAKQSGGFWNWYIWQQPVAFLLFFIAQIAETNRLPFDLPEGESELTGGFHTEYTGMKFSMFFMAEYTAMMTMAAMVAVLFLGGFHGPLPINLPDGPSWFPDLFRALSGFFWIMVKIAAQLFVMIWMRATLPRLRYDQLMSLGWKVMFELATINVVITAALVALIDSEATLKVVLFLYGTGLIVGLELAHQTWRRRTLRVT